VSDDQPEIVVPANGKTPYCVICCAEPGEAHDVWCTGTGVVTVPDLSASP
jgi:hypothetical protein